MSFSILLDHIRSAYNVGSIFRTADSAGVDKLILSGWCAIPPHLKLQKTALGSINSVSWEHHCSSIMAAKYLKSQCQKIVCFETVDEATSLFDHHFDPNSCLVFGNEELGINQAILELADNIIKIPQYGIKESLNVASAAAIAAYEYRRQITINNPSITEITVHD